jgi:hypothetical protein
MAKNQTPKEEYDDLIADLKAGAHSFNGRPVMEWGEYDVAANTLRYEPTPGNDAVPHPYASKHVVTVQYAGPAEGDGGLLRDYAFDAAALKASEPEAKASVEVADQAAQGAAEDAADKDAQAADEKADDKADADAALKASVKKSGPK